MSYVRASTANPYGFRPFQRRLGEIPSATIGAPDAQPNPGTVTASTVWQQLQAKGAQVYQDLQQTVTLPVVGNTPLLYIAGGVLALLAVFSGGRK